MGKPPVDIVEGINCIRNWLKLCGVFTLADISIWDDNGCWLDWSLPPMPEEVEKQKYGMRPPFQHTRTACDMLDRWEHNDRNSKEDRYWTFMGSALYDSSILGSILSICCSEEERLDEVT